MQLAKARLIKTKYDCLGCEVCFPAIAINALGVEGDACPAEAVEAREGWPPLPGSYQALRYHAPVAVRTLTDETLMNSVVSGAGHEIAIVGTMQTENLGIERLIQNTISNPHIRFVVLCGADSRQTNRPACRDNHSSRWPATAWMNECGLWQRLESARFFAMSAAK